MTSVPGEPAAPPSLWQQIWRRKPVTVMTEETGTDVEDGELKRTLGLFQLSLFGIGATIGTGIFIVLTRRSRRPAPLSCGPSRWPASSPV